METNPGEVTRLLKAMNAGDAAAGEQLLPLVYKELHRIAEAYMRRERPDASWWNRRGAIDACPASGPSCANDSKGFRQRSPK